MIFTTHTYTSARGNTITVRRPMLTDEQRAEQMKVIKQAATRLVLETDKAKMRKNKIK
jgi:ribosome recycling factor